MQDFKGKTAVITGAGSGIGRGVALALARAGVNIVAAEIRPDRAKAIADEVTALGSQGQGNQGLGVVCDVGSDMDLQAARKAALDRFGRIDILMNNVGILFSGPFAYITMDNWRRSIEINFLAMVRAVQLILPDIKKQSEGHVINVASTAALYPYNADRMPYNATKAAVISFSEGLAMDLAESNIGVTCLCPGPVITNIREQMTFVGPNPPALGAPDLAIKQPDEVAELVMEALRKGTFFLPSNPEVHGIVKERWSGVDAFLAKAKKLLHQNKDGAAKT